MFKKKTIMLHHTTTKHANAWAMLILTIGLAVLSNKPLLAQEDKQSPGIFYAVTGNGLSDTSWLFGTFHLINNGYLDEHQVVVEKFKKARGLVVEIIMDSTSASEAQAMGLMQNNTLEDILKKPFADSLDAELKATAGVGLAQFNTLKPMNVMLTLSIVHLMKNNQQRLARYTGIPMDFYFVKEGKKLGKSITALETVTAQMELLFNGTSELEQAEQLKTFLRNKQQMVDLGDQLMLSWFNNDLETLYKIYERTLQLSGEPDKLIKERNRNWLKQIPALIQQSPQFIATGALHLAGPDGLVNRLGDAGYKVTPIKF
jgi:uncharacterized protein